MPKRQCYAILRDEFDAGSGYVPCIVTEGDITYSALRGKDESVRPWYWGMTPEIANKIAAKSNADDFGVSPEEAAEIIESAGLTAYLA